MAHFRYGISHEVTLRRSEFFGQTFDEMVEQIIQLEADLEERTDELADAQKEIAELQATGSPQ